MGLPAVRVLLQASSSGSRSCFAQLVNLSAYCTGVLALPDAHDSTVAWFSAQLSWLCQIHLTICGAARHLVLVKGSGN